MKHHIRAVALARHRRARRQTGIPLVAYEKPRHRTVCPDCGDTVLDFQPFRTDIVYQDSRLLGQMDADQMWLRTRTHRILCPMSIYEIGISCD